MALPFGYTFHTDFHGNFLLFLSLALALAFLVLLANKRVKGNPGQLNRVQHQAILTLRIGALVLLLLLVFDPRIALDRIQTAPKKVAIVIDQSSSMLNAWDGTDDDLQTSIRSIVEQLEERFEVDLWSMAGEPLVLGNLRFEGESSAFAWAPETNAINTRDDIYQTAFLISDGQLNGGRSPLDLPWTKTLPLYPVYPLQPKSNTELKIEDLRYEYDPSANGDVQIWIKIQAKGLAGKIGSLDIYDENNRIICEQTFTFTPGLSDYLVSIHSPEKMTQDFRFVLKQTNGDLQSEKWLTIDLDSSLKKVLLVSERVNELHKFLLLNLPDSLYEVQIVMGTTLARDIETQSAEINQQPALLILNQPGEKVLDEKLYQLLHLQIERAAPIILFHDGSERMAQPLLDLLEIQQQQSQSGSGEAFVDWSRTASQHPIYLELLGQGISPAELLKYTPLYQDRFELHSPGSPLLVSGPSQRPHSVLSIKNNPPVGIFSGGEIWRWFFHPQASRSFVPLWNNLLLYLEEISNFKPVQLEILAESAATGAYVNFDVVVKNMNNEPISTAEVRVWQEDETGAREALDFTRNNQGGYGGHLITKVPGEVTVIAEAYRFGELWGQDTSTIQLMPFNGEYQSVGVDEVFLARLANRSGTEIIEASVKMLPALSKQYYTKTSSIHLKGVRSTWMFVMLVTLLVIEWILRRRNGLL